MTSLVERVEHNILHRRLLKTGGAVLVAVSGGLDSMSLLEILHALSTRHRWNLTVAHFNHQLRGRSSDADERLVCKRAAALKWPFITARGDVRKFAKKSKLSIEMAARKLRHEFFVRVAKEEKIPVVALAHHGDDQVELFFLRALRGTGGEGLAGMKWRSPSPVSGTVTLIRPLLDTSRTDLLAFAREHRVPFREDATNAQLDLPRNRVRHELLPLLRRRYQPGLTKAILRLMEIVGSEAEVISEAARQWLKSGGTDLPASRQAPQGFPTHSNFWELPVALQRRVLQLQLAGQGIVGDFDLVERLRCSPDAFVSVSGDFSVARDAAGRVRLRSATWPEFRKDELAVRLAETAGKVIFGKMELCWNLDPMRPNRLRPEAGCERFDADKVGGRIKLRHWRAGDRFQPLGMKSAVKLQDLFINHKIPRAQRHGLVIAEAAGGEIFWVQNLRMAEHFKVTPGTRRCLIWRWRCLH